MKKKFLSALSALFIFSILLTSFSCNNDSGKPKEKKETTTDTSPKKEANNKLDGATDLNQLILPAETLVNLFASNNNVKELVFQFEFRGNDGWGLSVRGTDKKGAVITGPYSLDIIPDTKSPIPVGATITNQSVKRGAMKEFLGLRGIIKKDKIINDTDFVDIRITPSPVLGENNSVFFILTKMPGAAILPYKADAEGQIITNPSPPAKPCDSGCDDPS